MKKVALQNVTPLPADFVLKNVLETSVIGLVVQHSQCGRGIVVDNARDCWTIRFDEVEFSGDYSPTVCYKLNLLSCENPGFDDYMKDYVSFYS